MMNLEAKNIPRRMSSDCPDVNPARTKHYINFGEDDQMEIIGYRRNILKTVIAWIFIILTLGLLRLIFFWRPEWMLKCMSDLCCLDSAQSVLLKDQYNQCFVHKVHVRLREVSPTFKIDSNNYVDPQVSLDVVGTKTTVDPFATSFVMKQKYCFNKKLKYIWNYESSSFEKISIPQLGCSYFYKHHGLSVAEQAERRWMYGDNHIRVHVTPLLVLLITQGLSPFYVFQLFSVLLWSAAEEYYYYAGCILFISIVSLAAQIIQQRMMERELKKTVSAVGSCIVYRTDSNDFEEVQSDVLVPGDVVRIPPNGCMMQCDAVLVSGSCIVNESMLTGESVPITKTPIPNSANSSFFNEIEHSRHVLYCGTEVIQTRSFNREDVLAVVIRTGFNTTKGNLVRSIMFPKPVDFKFTVDGYKYVGVLALIALGGMLYTLTIMIKQENEVRDIIVRMLDLVTIVVPPALPAAMTCGIVFAQGRLRKEKVHCISPRTINVCGSIDAFCFDKTGTLTEDGLDLFQIRAATEDRFVDEESSYIESFDKRSHKSMISAMATCHSLTIIDNKIVGDPLDKKMFNFTGWELIEMGDDADNNLAAPTVVKEKLNQNGSVEFSNPSNPIEIGVLKQMTFSSKLQRMSVIVRQRGPNGDCFGAYAKGSPEMIKSLSQEATIPSDFDSVLTHYTEQGYRVLALAWKPLFNDVTPDRVQETLDRIQTIDRADVECDLAFLGLLVLENRLKDETKPVILQLKRAKIRTIMVTGDNMLTALSVARTCSIVGDQDRVIMVSVVPSGDENEHNILYCPVKNTSNLKLHTNGETNGNACFQVDIADGLSKMDVDGPGYHFAINGKSWALLRQHFKSLLPKLVVKGTIFARFAPEQKQQLIEELQAVSYYVGMCGDGANDCGALKTAHAGISLSEAEASVASPFTSKDPNITCVPTLISEGRCALVTSYGIFKFMAGYSMTQFLIACMVIWFGSYLADFQFLYEDLVLLTTLCITFCFTKPYPVLVAEQPMISLIALTPIVSLAVCLGLNLAVMIFSFYYVLAQPWHVIPDDYSENANQDTTCMFLITCSHFITMGIIFSKGAPFRKSIFTNYLFLINIILCVLCNTEMIFYPANWWSDLMQFEMPPSYGYRAIIFGISIMHFFASYLAEAYFIDELVEKRLQPALSKLLFKESVKHRIVEKDLSMESHWPPLTYTDISEVMELENSAFANLTRELEADKMKSQDDVPTEQHINLAFEEDDDYTRPSRSGSVDEEKKTQKVYMALVKNNEDGDDENKYLDQDDAVDDAQFESTDLADEQTDHVPLVIDNDDDDVDGIQLSVL